MLKVVITVLWAAWLCPVHVVLHAAAPQDTVAPAPIQQPALPDPHAVQDLLKKALGKDEGACAVAMLRLGKNTMVVGAGAIGAEAALPDDLTIFEIGSITKVFTATLWELAVQREEVTRTATLGDCFGAERAGAAGRAIRLADLATHRSGLPRLPANFKPKSVADPYADYSLGNALEALAAWKAPSTTPVYAYSNFGFGLLGEAVAAKCGAPWGTLIHERITKPLKLSDTGMELNTEQQTRYAVPRLRNKPFTTWRFQCMAGAGALKSTAADLLRFLDAQEICTEANLLLAFEALRGTLHPVSATMDIGFGWHVVRGEGDKRPWVWHNGGTGGSRSYCGFFPGRSASLVVLANCAEADVDGAARSITNFLR